MEIKNIDARMVDNELVITGNHNNTNFKIIEKVRRNTPYFREINSLYTRTIGDIVNTSTTETTNITKDVSNISNIFSIFKLANTIIKNAEEEILFIDSISVNQFLP